MSVGDPSIIPTALDWLGQGRRVALATVIETWGSSPQPVGSKLLIDADGNFVGSVSGGCVEAEVVTEAADVIADGKPRSVSFGVEDGKAWQVGLACGGSIRILIEPLMTAGNGGAGSEVFTRLLADLGRRRAAALVTELSTGARRLVHGTAEAGPQIAEALAHAFRHDKSGLVKSETGETFIDVFNPPLRLIIVGAVHIAQSLLPLAENLGYDVTIVDPRGAFATPARFGKAKLCRDWPDEALPKLGSDANTALVALTHDPKLDDPALLFALRSDALYVGALGSRKTHAKRVDRLLAAGLSAEAIERIHAPIGLDIGAEGPAEIALSIIAEIVAAKRGRESRGR
jgi:xanthine dehydrogenase accessory factor